jgi:hypothetical protein
MLYLQRKCGRCLRAAGTTAAITICAAGTTAATLNIDARNHFNHASERIILLMRLPSRRYLLQLFPPTRMLLFLMAAILLTFASSLIPRPIYGPGEQTIRFGYPMPYLNLTLEPAATGAPVVFISWWGARAVSLEWGLALLNVGFFLVAFALFRLIFRPGSTSDASKRPNPS